jgi:hypothetical protein
MARAKLPPLNSVFSEREPNDYENNFGQSCNSPKLFAQTVTELFCISPRRASMKFNFLFAIFSGRENIVVEIRGES